jgi:hypothetical protein
VSSEPGAGQSDMDVANMTYQGSGGYFVPRLIFNGKKFEQRIKVVAGELEDVSESEKTHRQCDHQPGSPFASLWNQFSRHNHTNHSDGVSNNGEFMS